MDGSGYSSERARAKGLWRIFWITKGSEDEKYMDMLVQLWVHSELVSHLPSELTWPPVYRTLFLGIHLRKSLEECCPFICQFKKLSLLFFLHEAKSDSLPARVLSAFVQMFCECDVRATLTQRIMSQFSRGSAQLVRAFCAGYFRAKEKGWVKSEKQRKAEKIYSLFTRCIRMPPPI